LVLVCLCLLCVHQQKKTIQHPTSSRSRDGGGWRRRAGGAPLQGVASTQFPGVLVGPLPVRKCHQMSSKAHMQLDRVVRWVLSTPARATPRLAGRWAVRRRVMPVLPLLLCTYSPRARLAFGWGSKVKAPLPLRASSPAVGFSPGPVLSPVTGLRNPQFASLTQLRPSKLEIET
jgi:hypothetical protein